MDSLSCGVLQKLMYHFNLATFDENVLVILDLYELQTRGSTDLATNSLKGNYFFFQITGRGITGCFIMKSAK